MDRLPKVHCCPSCRQPCPANEFAAYGRHEECAIPMPPSAAVGRLSDAAMTFLRPLGSEGKRVEKKSHGR